MLVAERPAASSGTGAAPRTPSARPAAAPAPPPASPGRSRPRRAPHRTPSRRGRRPRRRTAAPSRPPAPAAPAPGRAARRSAARAAVAARTGRTPVTRAPWPASQRAHCAPPQPTSSTSRPATSPSRRASSSYRPSGHHRKRASPRNSPCSAWYSSAFASHHARFARSVSPAAVSRRVTRSAPARAPRLGALHALSFRDPAQRRRRCRERVIETGGYRTALRASPSAPRWRARLTMDARRAYPGFCAAEPVWFQTEGTAPTEPLISHRSTCQDGKQTATRVRPPPRACQPTTSARSPSPMTSSTRDHLDPAGRDQRHRVRGGLPRRDRRDHQVLQRRRHRRRHHRQGRPRRGSARHRLQDRGRHPVPRAVDQARRRPARGRQDRRPRRGPCPPEGGQGGPPDPVQEARAVRARLGHDREDQGGGRRRHRHRHRGRQGRPHPRHRPARLPARVAGGDAPGARPAAVRRQGDRSQDHRAGQEPQQRGPVPPGLARADPVRGAPHLPQHPAQGPDPQGVRSRRSSTSARSSTLAASTAWCTCPSCPGSTSTTRARSSRSARRSRSRSSTSTWTASASRCRSRPRRKTRGSSSPAPTRSARSSRAGSPSWCRSARSSGSTRASRAWCTSPSWPSATWRSRSRSSRSATRSSSRSSTSTWTVGGSACRSSRRTRVRPARASGDEFDPTLYGMPATYDEQGNYVYPDGFDPETGEWLAGLRRAARGVGAAVRRGPAPASRRTEADRGVPGQGRRRGCGQRDRHSRGGSVELLLDAVQRGHRHARLRRAARRPAREAGRRPELTRGSIPDLI